MLNSILDAALIIEQWSDRSFSDGNRFQDELFMCVERMNDL